MTDPFDFEADLESFPAVAEKISPPKKYRAKESEQAERSASPDVLGDEPAPETDAKGPLKGKSVYISVFSDDGVNVTAGFKTKIEKLGAKVAARIGKQTYAVVFKNGKPLTVQQAQEVKVPIVSPLWIEKCEETGSSAPLESFIIKSPIVGSVLIEKQDKQRRKSMEPRDVDVTESTDAKFSSSQQIKSAKAHEETSSDKKATKTPKKSLSKLPAEQKAKPSKKESEKKTTSTSLEKGGNALPSLQKKKDGDDSDGMEDDENLGISESSKEDSAKEPPKKQKAPEKKKDTPNVSSKAGSEGKKRKSVEGEAPQSDITVENARKTAKQKTKPTNAKEPRIALSGLVPSDRALAYDVVGNLGGKVVDVVDDATTHVVAASKRTVKMLAGIARGIWIVTPEWLFKSLDEGKWADESEFESNVVPGAKKARTNKALGMGLLFSSKTILVIGETTPPREEFEELIIAAGGEITQYVTNISFCVAAAKSDVPTSVKGVPVVLDSFVLDSLSQGRLLECDSYKHPSWDGKVDQEAAPVTGDDEGDEEDEQEDYQDAEDGDEQAKDDS
eukprot:TRINITY_DN6265_c0_g1_i1.p1 TRINITY_DN6265_c0_g1~~TRINITY_DN6265_c0_g1_i1.p1  ORF type:complete len:560 (+),score=144.89 TRINITY_DN6265_c0_g1_i1:135-1814(+)